LQHFLAGVIAVRAVQHVVHYLVDDEHQKEPDGEYQVAHFLGGRAVGQQLVRGLQLVDVLTDLGQQVQKRGEQQHAAAKTQ